MTKKRVASLSESLSALLRGGQNPKIEVADAVETIGRRSLHLMNFVERYRKIADLPVPNFRPVLLREFISDIDSLMRPAMVEQGISYSSTFELSNLTLRVDPELLSQAIINLLHNATDAVSGMDDAIVSLRCRRVGMQIELAVADNGHGVAQENLQEIFVPFFTTKPGGSGIGLTLARQIIQSHGGQIEAIPSTSGGIMFKMTIPVADPG